MATLLEELRQSLAAPARPEIAPGVAPGLDHLSASSIAQYLRCPRQWWYVRVLGIKAPPDGGLISGSALHSAAEHGMRQKLATSLDPNASEVADVARDNARKRIDEAQELVEETGPWPHLEEEGMKPDSVVDKAARSAEAWAKEAAPNVEPVGVEEEFDAELGGVRVIGRLDVVEPNEGVRDWKTAGRTPSMADVAGQVATEVYATAKRGPLTYTYLVDTKTRGVEVVHVPISPRDLAVARALAPSTVSEVARAIAAGAFPRNRHGWHCSRRWCAFFDRCMSGRDRP
jgi:CRISPR/Cas system-associated exonuclease Cas4 (RecB family)